MSKLTKGRLFIANSLLFCLLLAVGCASTGPVATGDGPIAVEGIVSQDGRGFEGATVEIRPVDTPDAPATASTLSGESGRFVLDAPPGRYLLTARSKGGFSFFGRNPLNASANQRGVSLPLVPVHPVSNQKTEEGTERIEGRVRSGGEPVEGAQVFAYLTTAKGFRGPPYSTSAATGSGGEYLLELEPGKYHLVARKRAGLMKMGPLEPGDLFGVHPSMPLPLKTATALTADMEVVEVPAPEQMARYRTRFARLEGLVTDDNGRPLAGFRACLYDNARMLDEPLEVSQPTGADGKFTLLTTRTGNFWLGARQSLGGPPRSGELVGFARATPPQGFALDPGAALTGLAVTVREVP